MNKNKISARVEGILIQLGEEEVRAKEKAEEAKVTAKEKEMGEKKSKGQAKEKKFGERFEKHFAESSKGMHDRMCALEEGMKSHEESLTKMLEMSEKLMSKSKE